ncbi:MAG: hypothetical protein K2G09_03505, partial [Paramuribaculum sp.]|nr:hypothetical protein [Paramuribaculum sp.]
FILTHLRAEKKDYALIMSIHDAPPLIETAVLLKKRVAVINCKWAIVNGIWRFVPQRLWRHISLKW